MAGYAAIDFPNPVLIFGHPNYPKHTLPPHTHPMNSH